ncbi:extracellular solute-binding protein [Paenibacillus sp. MWE-103]|uniref:Extracellular solute-binding protein n=1 Tax=Paenibacillus artemisiicola TaxID=1172618 RepID=A0ABS3W459_9BACL|nr:extracellular solute-binding protein [Paenibacillus artemisiicola]MBO7743091.1 extracellular solute-binding protein [Paenibacillus artemisiicola]
MKKGSLIIVWIVLALLAAACSKGGSTPNSSPSTGSAANFPQSGTSGPSKNDSTAAPSPMPAPDPDKKSTIVFSMYSYDPYYEDAKKAYEKAHPNITIDLNYVTKEFDPSGLLVEKFRTKTAAEFLSGKGADMIMMDDLPADSFIGKHLLANLSEMMDGDTSFQKENYLENIIDNMKESDGSVYAMPLSFYVSALLADQNDLERSGVKIEDGNWTWDQFAAAAKRLPMTGRYKYAYAEKQESNFLYALVTSAYSQFVDRVNRKAYFDSDRFTGMLNQIKQLEKDKAVTFDFSNYGHVYFMQTDIYSFRDFMDRAAESKFENPALYEAPKAEGQQEGGYFSPIANIAINANSSVKPEAWDFLKFLMSGGAGHSNQKQDGSLSVYNTFPISKTVFAAQQAEYVQEGKADQEELRILTDFISKASNRKSTLPYEIEILIWDESPAFFSGQKSAEAVARIIQNKATTYLNE